MPDTPTTRKPPSWLKQGISALVGGLVVLVGTVITASVDWRQSEINREQMLAGGYVELFEQLWTDVRELRIKVTEQDMRITRMTRERDSMAVVIQSLTEENKGLQYRVYWLERQARGAN